MQRAMSLFSSRLGSFRPLHFFLSVAAFCRRCVRRNTFKFNFTDDLSGCTIRNANATDCIIHKTNDNNIYYKGDEMKNLMRIIQMTRFSSVP